MTARPPTERPRAAVLALVLALHGLLLWHWPSAPVDARLALPAAAPVVVALQWPPAAPPPARPVDTSPSRTVPRPPAAAPDALRAAPMPAPSSLAPADAALALPPTPPSAAPPATQADAPRPLNLALPQGAGAERGALTEPVGSMRRAALNDPRSNMSTDPTRALPDAVAASAKGDCMKGDYAGGGMGLLSLPFLAVAALRGDCKPVR